MAHANEEDSDTFFKVEHNIKLRCSLNNACGKRSIINFNNLCKPIEIYIYARKKHPFTSYSTTNHLKHSKSAITDVREKTADLFSCTTRASTLAPAIILRLRISLQTFLFLQKPPFHTINHVEVVFHSSPMNTTPNWVIRFYKL